MFNTTRMSRTYLEACWTPVDKLDAPLGLDGGNGSIDVLGNDVAPVEHAAGHVLAMAGVALHHLVGRLKAGVGDLSHAELLMVSLLSRDDRGVGDQREVDPEEESNQTSIKDMENCNAYLG